MINISQNDIRYIQFGPTFGARFCGPKPPAPPIPPPLWRVREAVDGGALEIEVHGQRCGDVDVDDMMLQLGIPQIVGKGPSKEYTQTSDSCHLVGENMIICLKRGS